MAKNGVLQRQYDLKRVNHLYSDHMPYGPDVCVYCGDPANSIDHVAPISYVASLQHDWERHRLKLRHSLYRVPACKDCNTRLSAFVGTCITEKRAELKRRLRRRYARLLGEYDWHDDDLAELGYTLSTTIKSQERLRERILARLSFPAPWEATMLRNSSGYR